MVCILIMDIANSVSHRAYYIYIHYIFLLTGVGKPHLMLLRNCSYLTDLEFLLKLLLAVLERLCDMPSIQSRMRTSMHLSSPFLMNSSKQKCSVYRLCKEPFGVGFGLV